MNTMLRRSATWASASTTAVVFATGTDSPVSSDSSASNAV
jgi:hypothetical protein